MSKFYGSIRNNRSEITKCGHNDGLNAHIRGWNKGIRVEVGINATTGKEYYKVYETGGSNGGSETLVYEG